MTHTILVVSNLYPPLMRGGAERVAMAEAEALARAGHRVVVLSTGAREERTKQGGVEVCRFAPALPYAILQDAKQPLWKRLWWHARDLWPTTSARAARELLREVRPDRIVLHNMRGMGLGAWRELTRAKVPVEQVWHDVGAVVPSGLWWVARHRPLWQWAVVRYPYALWLQCWLGRSITMRFPSRALRDVYARHGWGRVWGHVLVQSNQVAAIPADLMVSASVQALVNTARASGVRVWGFVGHMGESKGSDIPLRAAARQTQAGELWMIGDGPERAQLEAWANAHMPAHVRVRWLGTVHRADLFAALGAMHALLMPSLVWENCPGVVLEAQSVGVRVFGSDAGGLRELLPEADRIPAGDVIAWARAMEGMTS